MEVLQVDFGCSHLPRLSPRTRSGVHTEFVLHERLHGSRIKCGMTPVCVVVFLAFLFRLHFAFTLCDSSTTPTREVCLGADET